MGVSTIEDPKPTCCLSPKIYQPATDMEGMTEFPKKKKMFASSSFYEEPNAIYPTVEEQVQLCRKIAESLSDDCNVKSKGANMFFKRVKKAEKWVVAESNCQPEEELSEHKDLTNKPYVRPKKDGPPNLKLIMARFPLVDMETLLREGVDIVQHDAISPDIIHGLVKDLNSTSGRGGQLFAKRKLKSEEWVVDEETVKNLMQTRYGISTPDNSRLPDIDSQRVVDTVIRAAEAKVMPNAIPHMPVIESLDGTSSQDWLKNQSEAYKVRAPKGWTSNTSSSLSTVPDVPMIPLVNDMKTDPIPTTASNTLPEYSPIRRTMSFNNFNSTPRAWNADQFSHFRPVNFKSIKPPSVLVQ